MFLKPVDVAVRMWLTIPLKRLSGLQLPLRKLSGRPSARLLSSPGPGGRERLRVAAGGCGAVAGVRGIGAKGAHWCYLICSY